MTRFLFAAAFVIGALAIIWTGSIFIGTSLLGLATTVVIAFAYITGALELRRFRHATASLDQALASINSPVEDLEQWLNRLDRGLRHPVRLRIEGERVGLPSPTMTPYLVGLLVMLGLLGTFFGMVETLKGAVGALQGTSELEAIRAGLAAPIEGLGLAFGTSVAGVAASAMLGLLSTLSRRERLHSSRLLDEKVSELFRDYSRPLQQQQTYQAIQTQSQALPEVTQQLTVLAKTLENMSTQLSEQILTNQTQFQEHVAKRFDDLTQSVDDSLKTSLAESGRLAGEAIEPMAMGALNKINDAAQQSQQQQTEAAEQQLSAVKSGLENNNQLVRDALQEALAAQQQATEQLTANTEASLTRINDSFTERSDTLVARLGETSDSWAESQNQQLTQLAATTEASLTRINDSFTENSDALITKLGETSDNWAESQSQQLTQLIDTLKQELNALREDEGQRGAAVVEKLGELEEKVADHLTTLGTGLEEPMLRLIETASETPRAAAEVIEKLRTEISNNIERDNDLLAERARLMEHLDQLSSSLVENSTGQRDAIEQLVSSSAETLSQVSSQFGEQLDSKVDKLTEAADHFTASSNDIASLGEAFGVAVEQFSESNRELIENLNRIESALEASNDRSDEQLGYYVAQAREIIDHNLMAQKDILDALNRTPAEVAEA